MTLFDRCARQRESTWPKRLGAIWPCTVAWACAGRRCQGVAVAAETMTVLTNSSGENADEYRGLYYLSTTAGEILDTTRGEAGNESEKTILHNKAEEQIECEMKKRGAE